MTASHMDAAGRWRALGLTGASVVLALTTWFSLTAVLPQVSAEWSLSAGQAGWLTNAVQLGFVLGALGSSLLALSDRVPLRALLFVATLAAGLFNGLLLLDLGVGWVIAMRALTGAALASIYPPALKLIATWFVRGRGLAMGAMIGALTIGSAMPHLIQAMGAALDWRVVVGAASAACAGAALLVALTLREGPHAFPRATVDPTQIGAILRDRPVMLANAGYFGHMWELYAMWGWLLAYTSAASEAGGWGLNASLLVFAVIAMGAPGSLALGWLADRVGRCRATALAMAVSGACAALIGLAFDGPLWLFVPLALLWGLTVVADSAQFSAAVTELANPRYVGSALALQMGVGFSITMLTIWLVPQIAELTGSWRWSFLVLVPGPLLGALAMLRLRRLPEAARMAGGLR